MLHVENRVLAAGGVADQDETAATAEISVMIVSIKFDTNQPAATTQKK